MPSWSNLKFMKSPLGSNASKSSLCLPPDARSSPIYHDPTIKAQATSSELRLDQQNIRRLQSKPSHLNQSAKPPSNFSADSFYTADQEDLSDSSRPSRRSRRSQPAEDVTQTTIPDREETAKSFADRAWREDPGFVDREKLVEWLGSPSEIRQQALGYYMANFDFVGVSIDEAIRRLCQKLYIKGETQQIDRILESFSQQFIEQNPNAVWKYTDIVHVVTFAIILLNTDLQAAELQAHITNNRFVDNTMDAIRSQLREPSLNVTTPIHEKFTNPEHLPDIQELPQTPTTPMPLNKSSAPPNLERHTSTMGRDRQSSVGSISLNRDSWIIPPHPEERGGERTSLDSAGSERWLFELSRELSKIYHNVRNKPILQPKPEDSPASPQSKLGGGLLKRGSAKLYHSLRGESPYAQSSGSPSASGASFVTSFGHRVSSSMSSLPQLFGITSNPSFSSSTNADLTKSSDSRWARTGSLVWKSAKPTPGRIAKPKRWLSVVASIGTSSFEMNSPPPPGSNPGTGRPVGKLSLLHALAQEVPGAANSRARSFSLTLSSGEIHILEIQVPPPPKSKSKSKSQPTMEADTEALAWVRACNYHAAKYSRAPLPDGVTNVEYGWNGAAAFVNEDDDHSSVNGGRSRNVLIDDWVAPTLPSVETQLDVEAQLNSWNHQVDLCNAEFAEHGELRGRMMSLYKPGSIQAQKALTNWEKKAQYLLTEIVKYETYVEILKNTELSSPTSA